MIKRAPKAKIKRKTFEVTGPGVEGAVPLDARARQVFGYFQNYNYKVKSKGEVITFEGNFRGSFGEPVGRTTLGCSIAWAASGPERARALTPPARRAVSCLAGQAAALVLYTFVGLGSTALVLSIAAPFGGNLWYALCALSPAAGAYYLKNAERTEEFKVKMVTADDDLTTDIVVEGDDEEIERFRRELDLGEKGMVRVKGLLEQ